MQEDTIAAIATSVAGAGGIGIVRISGDASEGICRTLFRAKHRVAEFKSHHLYHGDLISQKSETVIDEVLISLMKAPHSYTGEDVLEIHCHGSPLILQAVLQETCLVGARLAGPGEFTRRAFVNNRIDLAQAEAIADLITAKTERGLQQAIAVLKGTLTEKIKGFRSSLLDVAVYLETSIDFSEEDDIDLSREEPCSILQSVRNSIEEITATYQTGRMYREGFNVVITGRPNVGKSSLLNRLAGERRAIVTAVPGTTRDFIDAEIRIKGVPVRFTDTAGIRTVDEPLEREGVDHAWERAAQADLVLVLLDGHVEFSDDDREIMEKHRTKRRIVVVNKIDLPPRWSSDAVKDMFPEIEPLFVSAKAGTGIETLKDEIYRHTHFDEGHESEVLLANLRHRVALEEAADAVGRAVRCLEDGASPELPACDVKKAITLLDGITGESIDDEVLDRIFSNFCIGK